MTVFWDEERIQALNHRIEVVDNRRFDDAVYHANQLGDVKARLAKLEQASQKKGEVVAQGPSRSAKERITELRLTALETGKPIEAIALVREAMELLEMPVFALEYQRAYEELYRNNRAAIALLEFAVQQHAKQNGNTSGE